MFKTIIRPYLNGTRKIRGYDMRNINQEEQSLVDFACRVCRIKNNSCRSKKGDCAYRAIAHEYCPEVMQALKERNGASEVEK